MFWIVSMILAVIVCSGVFLLGKALRGPDSNDNDKAWGKAFLIISPVLLVAWMGLHTTFVSIHQLPFGNVGVVTEFGAIKGQVSEGFQIIAPWQKLIVANIQVQGHQFERLTAFSQETQDVFVKATLNIRVSPRAIQDLYRNVGPNYFDVVVAPRVEQNFKDVTVLYDSVDIAPNRENIRQAVRKALAEELEPYSIEVVDLLLDDIDFNPEFKASIEAKQIATQNALEEEQRVTVAKHRASQVVKTAEGEGAAILAVAEKQAEANEKLAASIDDRLVRYTLVQKLSPNIKVMILPAGQEFILGSDILASMEEEENTHEPPAAPAEEETFLP